MSIFEQIVIRIIKEQELIIGPLAWIEASKVPSLGVHEQGVISIDSSNKQEVIDALVAQYERLFGRASHEVCKHAVAGLIVDLKDSEVPSSLK
ncbi:MAG: hypothetical protein V4486_00070 [Patescibacteria group bacterium]